MRRLLALLVSTLLTSGVLVACSSDGSTDDFCAALEGSTEEVDLDTPEGLAAFQEFVDAAPSELKEPMQTISETIASLDDLDENDPDAFGAFFGAFLDPEFLAALTEVETWGVENCDLPEGFLGADEAGAAADDAGGFTDDAGGFTDDLDAASGDNDLVETADVRAYLEATYGDAAPYADVVSLSAGNGSLTAGFADEVSIDDALDVCEAVGSFVFDGGPYDDTIEISVTDAEGETLVVRDGAAAECEAA